MASHGFRLVRFEPVFMPTGRARRRVEAAGNNPDDTKFYDPRPDGGDLVMVYPSRQVDLSRGRDPRYRRPGGPRR